MRKRELQQQVSHLLTEVKELKGQLAKHQRLQIEALSPMGKILVLHDGRCFRPDRHPIVSNPFTWTDSVDTDRYWGALITSDYTTVHVSDMAGAKIAEPSSPAMKLFAVLDAKPKKANKPKPKE